MDINPYSPFVVITAPLYMLVGLYLAWVDDRRYRTSVLALWMGGLYSLFYHTRDAYKWPTQSEPVSCTLDSDAAYSLTIIVGVADGTIVDCIPFRAFHVWFVLIGWTGASVGVQSAFVNGIPLEYPTLAVSLYCIVALLSAFYLAPEHYSRLFRWSYTLASLVFLGAALAFYYVAHQNGDDNSSWYICFHSLWQVSSACAGQCWLMQFVHSHKKSPRGYASVINM